MAALDNIRQTIYNIKDVIVDVMVDEDGEEKLVLNGEDFCNVQLSDIFNEFIGYNIDLKISGAEPINPLMFEEREHETE